MQLHPYLTGIPLMEVRRAFSIFPHIHKIITSPVEWQTRRPEQCKPRLTRHLMHLYYTAPPILPWDSVCGGLENVSKFPQIHSFQELINFASDWRTGRREQRKPGLTRHLMHLYYTAPPILPCSSVGGGLERASKLPQIHEFHKIINFASDWRTEWREQYKLRSIEYVLHLPYLSLPLLPWDSVGGVWENVSKFPQIHSFQEIINFASDWRTGRREQCKPGLTRHLIHLYYTAPPLLLLYSVSRGLESVINIPSNLPISHFHRSTDGRSDESSPSYHCWSRKCI
jgi:hypothetical protein